MFKNKYIVLLVIFTIIVSFPITIHAQLSQLKTKLSKEITSNKNNEIKKEKKLLTPWEAIVKANERLKAFPKEDVKFILKNVKPGDIMIQRNFDISNAHTTGISKAVAGGKFLHSAIYLGKNEKGEHLIAESVGGGPQINTLTQYLGGRNDVMILRPDYEKGQAQKVIDEARKEAEKPSSEKDYDMMGDNSTDDRYYCNELTYKSLKRAGVKLPEANDGKISPIVFSPLIGVGAYNHLRKGGALIGADTFLYMDNVKTIYGGRKDLPESPHLIGYTYDIGIKAGKVKDYAVKKVVQAKDFIVENGAKVINIIGDAGVAVKDFAVKKAKQVGGTIVKGTESVGKAAKSTWNSSKKAISAAWNYLF